MASRTRIYIESASFIDIVRYEVGDEVNPGRENDIWHMKQLLQAHRDREIDVFTSMLTIAECRRAKNRVDDEVKNAFERLLISGQYLSLIQPTLKIARMARDLEWNHEINIPGPDALHVASALERECEEIFTTDRDLTKESVSSALANLGLRVVRGADTRCLPEKYRQRDLLEDC